MGLSSSQCRRPPFSLGILCPVVLMLLWSPCAARKDPGGGPAGLRLATWKLSLAVVLSVVAAAALLTLIIFVFRRCQNRDAAVVASSGGNGFGGKEVDFPSWAAATRPSRPPGPDHPMSINATMVRSAQTTPIRREAFPVSPPTATTSSPSPSPSYAYTFSVPQSQSPAPRVKSGGRRPPRRRAKREEQQVMKDPLASFSPAISVLLTEFDYGGLASATNGFATESLVCLRRGLWPVVHKGTEFVKDDGVPTTVAIKKFRGTFNGEQCKRIRADLKCKFTLRHKNLVSLLGYSLGNESFYLVYDYMSKGSLERHLFPTADDGWGLTWASRYKIAESVAQGLYQLHQTNAPHGSISVSSIMLDDAYTAHIDDHFDYRPDRNSASASSPTEAASIPAEIDAALKKDISDLGSVFLEIVSSRRRATAIVVGDETMLLVDWVWMLHGKGSLLTAVDMALEGNINIANATTLLQLGLLCSHPDPKLRPDILEVREILQNCKPMPRIPSSKHIPESE